MTSLARVLQDAGSCHTEIDMHQRRMHPMVDRGMHHRRMLAVLLAHVRWSSCDEW